MKLRISYITHPIVSLFWCKIFGHRWGRLWAAGGDDLCERCTKYKDHDKYWAYE